MVSVKHVQWQVSTKQKKLKYEQSSSIEIKQSILSFQFFFLGQELTKYPSSILVSVQKNDLSDYSEH